jgi:hypothetical protein
LTNQNPSQRQNLRYLLLNAFDSGERQFFAADRAAVDQALIEMIVWQTLMRGSKNSRQ